MSGRTVIELGVYHRDSGAVWVNLKIAQRTAGNGSTYGAKMACYQLRAPRRRP